MLLPARVQVIEQVPAELHGARPKEARTLAQKMTLVKLSRLKQALLELGDLAEHGEEEAVVWDPD